MSFWNFLTREWKYKILIKIPRNVVDDFGLCLWISSRYVFSCFICFRFFHFILISTVHALFLTFSPWLPTFNNFRTNGFQSHHKEDCVFNAHAHVAVELSVLAINTWNVAVKGLMWSIVGSNPWRVIAKTIKLVVAVSPLRTHHWGARSKIGWLGIRIMCWSGATFFLPTRRVISVHRNTKYHSIEYSVCTVWFYFKDLDI